MGRSCLLACIAECAARGASRAFCVWTPVGAIPVSAACLFSADSPVVRLGRRKHLSCPLAWGGLECIDADPALPAAVANPWPSVGVVCRYTGGLRWLATVYRARFLHRKCSYAHSGWRISTLSESHGQTVVATI